MINCGKYLCKYKLRMPYILVPQNIERHLPTLMFIYRVSSLMTLDFASTNLLDCDKDVEIRKIAYKALCCDRLKVTSQPHHGKE